MSNSSEHCGVRRAYGLDQKTTVIVATALGLVTALAVFIYRRRNNKTKGNDKAEKETGIGSFLRK